MVRRRRSAATKAQFLQHVTARTVTTAVDNVLPAALSLITNRPARISSLRIQYVAITTPVAFNFLVQAANGEEIYRSPLLLAGTIPRTFNATMPRNTDFGLYDNATASVVTINTAAPGIRAAMNMGVHYKYPTSTAF